MNKYSILCIIILIACASELEIICQTVCRQDGDAGGVIIKNTCYCANPRDVSKIIFKIDNNLRGQLIKNPPKYFFE